VLEKALQKDVLNVHPEAHEAVLKEQEGRPLRTRNCPRLLPKQSLEAATET
jgi:hypothetical protein